jgi:tripartite-type tricarboxylate transporter receptor subunit TctC
VHKIFFRITAIVITAIAGNTFAAEPWPAKPVRVIVPFPPGGYVDLGTRLVAGPLAAAIGQQVVVENRGGAGGSLGSDIAAHAPADGYTLVVGSVGTHAVNQSLYPKLPYNVLRDFVAVARLSDSPNVLAVHPSLPARTTQQLIALARAQPGQIAYASAGSGTSTHLAAVLFETLANVKLVHVAYKGGGPAMIDVVTGQVPVSFGTAASVTPHLKSGRVRGLGVTGSQRSALLPEVPTIAESGLKGYEMLNWLGMFAPTGTPRAITDRLAIEVTRIVRLPDVRERLQAQGAEPSPLAGEEFAGFVKREVEKWAKVVAVTKMTAD